MEKPLTRVAIITSALLLAASSLHGQVDSPPFDGENLTGNKGILFWTPEQQIYGYSRMSELYPTRPITGNTTPSALPVNLSKLDGFTYAFAGASHTVDSHMHDLRTAGLLVIHNGNIKVERYGLSHHPDAPWVSFSVTKSVVSMLFGAALKDGAIQSLNDSVSDYLPVFANSSYAEVTIEQILQMASGVAWNEDYADPASNIVNLPSEQETGFRYMGNLPRVAEPGKVFNYNTGETNIAGAILRKAIGQNLSAYAAETIFLPGGLSDTANWLLDAPDGDEFAGCCISANLRDYGRIGLFALDNSKRDISSSTLAPGWMKQAASPSAGYEGYGYFWWLDDNGGFSAQGVFGQYILVDPNQDLVIVLQSAWPAAWDSALEEQTLAFIEELARYVTAQESLGG